MQDAALSVFIDKGVDAATVEEITEKADLGKGTLYQHFSDKYEIAGALIEKSMNPLIVACAVAGFVFWFFSFAMIGINDDEIETSIKPLRQVFVRSLATFLGAVPTLPSGDDDVKTSQECTDK